MKPARLPQYLLAFKEFVHVRGNKPVNYPAYIVPVGEKGFVQPVFGNGVVFSELGKYKTYTKPTTEQRAVLELWSKSIRDRVKRVEDQARALGFLRLEVDLNDDKQFLSVLLSTCTRGSAGLWGKKYPAKDPFTQSKAGVFCTYEHMSKSSVLSEREVGESFFHELRAAVLAYNQHIAVTPECVYVQAVAKQEPMKWKKLMEGAGRSIQIPDWSVCVWEQWHSCFYRPGEVSEDCYQQVYTWDDIMAATMESNHATERVLHSVGVDTRKTVGRISERLIRRGQKFAFEYDVKQWDRNLPREMITAVYQATLHPSADQKRVVNHAMGVCGRGVIDVAGELYQFKEPTTAWCSGSLKTLCGNTLIHASLLDAAQAEGAVQGDDGLILEGVDRLKTLFNAVGMQWKEDPQPSAHVEYCAIRLDCETGRVTVDYKTVLEKHAAAHTIGFYDDLADWCVKQYLSQEGAQATVPA